MKYFAKWEIIVRFLSFYCLGANLAYAGRIGAMVV
jgi:hypothetical protein